MLSFLERVIMSYGEHFAILLKVCLYKYLCSQVFFFRYNRVNFPSVISRNGFGELPPKIFFIVNSVPLQFTFKKEKVVIQVIALMYDKQFINYFWTFWSDPKNKWKFIWIELGSLQSEHQHPTTDATSLPKIKGSSSIMFNTAFTMKTCGDHTT